MGIAFDVAGEFGLPEFGVVFWERVIAFGATVPVAAVDEDGDAPADERYIRANRPITDRIGRGGKAYLEMEPVATVAGVPDSLAKEQFGLCVLCPVGGHDAGDGLALWHRRSLVTDVHGSK
ncbi:MAG TPA: hypothetical protein PKD24_06185 [Pyrinomonadaceae bacterium]|nr:hypothetical protein [Pyrinomonadaceae bacterium]HMP65255.1 hypothetical protein [Pyrinomonadaceae bacterium]